MVLERGLAWFWVTNLCKGKGKGRRLIPKRLEKGLGRAEKFFRVVSDLDMRTA